MQRHCGMPKQERAAAIDAHLETLFSSCLGLARNAFHFDADPSEMAFARFGSEAACARRASCG
jgi:hypothetical protein